MSGDPYQREEDQLVAEFNEGRITRAELDEELRKLDREWLDDQAGGRYP